MPRTATIADASQPMDAGSLFDGDAATGFAIEAGKSGAVRLELGSTREVVGLGVHGVGRAKLAFYAEENGARKLISVGADGAINLQADHWAQVGAAQAAHASALVVQWTALPGASATITELAVWVAGRSRQALAEATIADRLVTELPENAVSATAVPWTASVARVTAQGSVSASFTIGMKGAPIGRTFLIYELDKKAHWTGVARSINGHVVRGGYRADAKGLGGVQVEEINPAWLKSGDNSVSFQPTVLEDGHGYNISDVRIVSVPRGIDAPPAPAARSSLSDGDLSTGVGGPGVHTASLAVPADREPAFLSFYLNKPTGGTLSISEDGGHGRRQGQVNVDLEGRPAGWQTVPVAGVLPPTAALRVRVSGDRESTGLVSETRVQWFPALNSPADLTVAYPLHGECQDHKTYVRGFVSGAGQVQKPQFFVDGRPMAGKIDADGSFEADVAEPATVRGKPWSFSLVVATEGGVHRTRTVPVDVCVEPPKGRILGVSPPLEDVGAPYGAVVSPGKASTLSFAGARIEIPAGAVDSAVRVTMRALDRGEVPPIQAEMDNVGVRAGAMRLGPHGLKFKKAIKVTLPVDPDQLPPGMTTSDVTGFFFDEGTSKWTQLPKLLVGPDRVIAETTHFTDFIAATLRTPEHPDGHQFNPNTMKGIKAGEPGAGITLIQPPEVNSSGTARLSYPIETPAGRNGIGPQLALTYDSERTNTNGWLGMGWDLRMSSVEIDTRFGVSQYNGTETYLLDGSALVPTSTPGTYIRRVDSSFDLIQRVGTGPTTYSWKVTDKRGTVFTYGTVANSRLANLRSSAPASIAGVPVNIFRWYLERVQDTYGNFMTVTYQHDFTQMGLVAPNIENFDEVYPSAIDYTGNGSLLPNYHVTFALDAAGTRPDTIINARAGFPVATRQRLASITVLSGTALVRQYQFLYNDQNPAQTRAQNLADTLQKSLLWAVALWGTQGVASSELYRHTFEYNKAPALGGMFSAQQTWGQVSQSGTAPRVDNGLSHSSDSLSGGAVTLGFGFPEFNVTGSFGMDSGYSNPDLAFFELTGEGLPDQIDTSGTLSLNGLLGTPPITNHFSVRSISGLPGLGSTDRSGWTAGGNVSALAVFGAGASYGRHLSNDRSVVTDLNGDGYPDIVFANGGTLNAYLNNGQQGFTPQAWNGYNLSNSPFSTAGRVTAAGAGTANAYFNTDPLVRWVAPFTGNVTVNVATAAETSTADNTRVDLYVATDAVRSVTIPAGDGGANHAIVTNLAKTVNAGDKVFFRVSPQGGSPSLDGVTLAASLAYTPPTGRSASELDPSGLPIFNYTESTDHRMAGLPRATWHLTGNGDLSVARCFGKQALPDDVTISYVIRDKTGAVVRHFDKVAPAMSKSAPPTWICFDSTVLPPSAADAHRATITNVVADQTIALEVTSDSPFDSDLFDAYIDGLPTMTYSRYCRTPASAVCGVPQQLSNGTYTIPGDPFPSFPIKGTDIEARGASNHPYYQTRVQRTFNNGTTTVAQPIRSQAAPSASVTFGGSVRTTAALTEDVVIAIQGVNKLHAKVRIPKGTASGVTFPVTGAACTVTSDCEQGRTCTAGLCGGAATVTSGEPVFFTISSPTVIGGNVTWSPTMNGTAVIAANINKTIQDATVDNNAPIGSASRDPMSGGFRQWFYADWNDSDVFSPSAVVRQTAAPQNADPIMGLIPVATDDSDEWAGRGGVRFVRDVPMIIEAGQVNNPVATSTSGSGQSALRIADTWNVDVTASAVGVTAGVNGGDGTTQVDFFDFNGDRYPDSVTLGGVQYNDGISSFSGRQSVDMRTEVGTSNEANEIRKILNVAVQAGVSVPSDGSGRKLINESDADGKTKKMSATVSLSGSADYGVSSTRIDFVDVNGDGLVDHVRQEPGDGMLRVRLNLGYGFSNEIPWTTTGWSQGNTTATLGWPVLPGGSGIDPIGGVLNKVPGSPNNTNVVRVQDTGTLSATIGGSVGGVVGGGGGPSYSITRKWVDMMDVNGDGLPDQVLKVPGTTDPNLHVKLNTGTGFAPEQLWGLPNWAPPTGFGANFSFLTPDGLGFSTINGWGENLNFQICFFICFGMSGYESDSLGGPSADFEDIDGDGKVDQVLKVPGDANVYAKLNNIGQTNLLAAVDRPLGSRFAITYTPTGNHVDLTVSPKINMPANQWTMASVVTDSGVVGTTKQRWNDETTQQFTYASPTSHNVEGFYDPVERENYGYSTAKTIYPGEDTGGTSIVATYFNQDFYQHHLEQTKAWYQHDATQVLQRTTTTAYADPSGKVLAQQPARTGVYFPAESEKDTFFYEMGSVSKSHVEQRTFDVSGNLTDVRDLGDGDFNDPSDDYNYHIDYIHPVANITVPFAVTARGGQRAGFGILLGKRSATYSPQGKPLTTTDVIANGKDPTTGTVRTEVAPGNATWTFTYDAFGNVQTATSPGLSATPTCALGTCGHKLQYSYDTTTQTYPVTTAQVDADPAQNAAYTSTAVYDLRFGLPTRIIDVDGARQETDYDNYGRPVSMFAPSDFDASGNRLNTNAPTIGFSYSEAAHTAGAAETLPAYAMATHRANAPGEGSLPGAAVTPIAIRTVNFADGLGRSIQVKKDITLDNGPGVATTAGMSVTGKTNFDARGRIYQQGQPTFSAGTTTPTAFVAVGLLNPNQYAYDVLGRFRQEQHLDDSGQTAITAVSYSVAANATDGRLYIIKTTTDPLYASNNSYHWRNEYQTVRGDTTYRIEPTLINGLPTTLTTSYFYDQLSRLTVARDANLNSTTASYDTLGNLVLLNSPDAGSREWRYCVGGYVCAEQSPKAVSAGTLIQYGYDRDRLKSITYPSDAPVTYVYGNANEKGAANFYKANRVKQRLDEAGEFDYAYDALGNVTAQTEILKNQIVPGTNYQSYQTTYTWDNFGRVIDVGIPGTTNLGTPAETIRYGYDAGGNVTSANGKVGTTTFPYVTHVGYNEFGERVGIKYGNSAFSTYAYGPDTRRLTNVNTTIQPTGQPAGRLAQALVYQYDLDGNVLARNQSQPLDTVAADVVPIGGGSLFNFGYDPLNQLTHADMFSQVKQSEDHRASVDIAYDTLGNVTSKTQLDVTDTLNAQGGTTGTTTNQSTSYTFVPTYGGTSFNPSPHAASTISETRLGTTLNTFLSYDQDGNVTKGPTGAGIIWTDTDRVRSMCVGPNFGCTPISQALYAADGTRTHNKTGGTETLYVNQYLTVRNGVYPTKHVYLGDTRVASKIETNATTNSTYWYHSDSLQSAQYVTTTGQALVQHLEYFPAGELWREENDTSKLLATAAPHATTFTGKELDSSGYYYFGARYYEPQTQMWLSPDPILGAYMKKGSAEASPKNLDVYTYAWNNPVVVTDPSGREVVLQDPSQKRYFENLINSRAKGMFKFDENNKLHRVTAEGNGKKYSSYFADRLEQAIENRRVITLSKAREYEDAIHRVWDVDADMGGGGTDGITGGDQFVVISGNSVTSQLYTDGKVKLRDTRGFILRNNAADILVHELVGHAIPLIVGSDTGNAVKNENKARSQEFAAGQRMPEPRHGEEGTAPK